MTQRERYCKAFCEWMTEKFSDSIFWVIVNDLGWIGYRIDSSDKAGVENFLTKTLGATIYDSNERQWVRGTKSNEFFITPSVMNNLSNYIKNNKND